MVMKFFLNLNMFNIEVNLSLVVLIIHISILSCRQFRLKNKNYVLKQFIKIEYKAKQNNEVTTMNMLSVFN